MCQPGQVRKEATVTRFDPGRCPVFHFLAFEEQELMGRFFRTAAMFVLEFAAAFIGAAGGGFGGFFLGNSFGIDLGGGDKDSILFMAVGAVFGVVVSVGVVRRFFKTSWVEGVGGAVFALVFSYAGLCVGIWFMEKDVFFRDHEIFLAIPCALFGVVGYGIGTAIVKATRRLRKRGGELKFVFNGIIKKIRL